MARFRFDVHVRLDLFRNVGHGLDVFRVFPVGQVGFVGLGKVPSANMGLNMGKPGHFMIR